MSVGEPRDDSRPPGAAPAGSRAREAALLLFLAIVSAGLTLYRVADRDLFTAHEARAARVARNMLEADQWPADKPAPWLVPQFSPQAPPGLNYQKPPLYYWAVALISRPLGRVTNLTVRLPSALSLVVLVLVTYGLGKAAVSVRAGFIAALVLASTPKMLWWGRAAVLDPMLAACVAGSLLAFYRAHRGMGGRWQYWLFWALVGLGTLVKATSLVVPLLAVAIYLVARSRQEGLWRPLWRLKPLSGALVLLAVAAPWHIAAHVATGGEFSRVYWGMHVFGRATGTGVFEDSTYWWYYFAAMARDLFPWVVFLPGALVQPWRQASREHRPGLLFAGVWFVGALVFFSAVSFRKDEYMLVAYPAAAVLIGGFLDYCLEALREDAALRPWVQAAFVIVAVATLLLGGGLLAVAHVPAFRERLLDAFHNTTDRATFDAVADLVAGRFWVCLLLAGPMMVGAVASVVCIRRGRPAPAVTLMICTTVLAFVLFVDMIVPVLDGARGLASFATTVEVYAKERGREVPVFLAVEECHELAFLLHRGTLGLESHRDDFPAWLKEELAAGRLWVVVMDREAYESGRWTAPGLAWALLDKTPPGHRRPMVILKPHLQPSTSP